MNYKIFRVTISIIFLGVFANANVDFEKDFGKAINMSKESNKPLFIMVSSPSCPECNYMKKEILSQSDVYKNINENFVPALLDVKAKNIPEQMKFWGIPRFYTSSDGENVINKKMGGMKKEQLIKFLKKGSL